MAPTTPQPLPDRLRVSLDLTPPLALLLDHVSTVTGVAKTAIVTQALIEALPAHLERLQAFKQAGQALFPAPVKGKK